MLSERIRSLFSRIEPSGPAAAAGQNVLDPLHLAACALLLDIAHADGEFSDIERVHIERSLGHHFSLSAGDIREVMGLAEEERKRAVDHFAFTSTLLKGYDTGQKLVLAEVMWGVAIADGNVAEHEHYLTRKIANLLNLEPGYLSAAKQAAVSKVESPGIIGQAVTLEAWIPLLTIGGTLLLVLTSLLNFSVFVRQLRASRELLQMAQRQLESSRQQPEILLVQRAMSETSDHLKVIIDKPYLRPYFYDNKPWADGDRATPDEVKAMAELMLNNFASAIIHAAAFPQYPVRSVEQTIRTHLQQSPAMREFLIEGFGHFQIAGLALLYLKNETRAEIERDLGRLIAEPKQDARERLRRQRLLQHVMSIEKGDALGMAKYSLENARSLPPAGEGRP